MNIEEIYDHYVADRYDADPFELIGTSRMLSVRQIRRQLTGRSAPDRPKVIDLGMGTGELLLQIRDLFPQALLHGRDLSARMVELASQKVRGAILTQGDATVLPEGAQALPPHSMDLAVTHFLLNYVDHERMVGTLSRLLSPEGYWSITTTTGESFPALRQLALNFVSEDTLRAQYNVPEHPAHLDEFLQKHAFVVRERMVTEQLIEFAEIDQLLDFSLHTGWFASAMLVQMLNTQLPLLRQMTRSLFPIRDVARITICLAQKLPQG